MGIGTPVEGFEDFLKIFLRNTDTFISKYYLNEFFKMTEFNINCIVRGVFAGVVN